MWRFLHLLAICSVIVSAAYVYGVKYRTIYSVEEIVKTRHEIAKVRDAINILRAEYARLARPDRVQAIADGSLGMAPLALNQIVNANQLPERAVKVDAIGQKLEALGLIGENATPPSGVTGATPSLR